MCSVLNVDPCSIFFLAHLLRAYAIQGSMFNFFLAHLLRAYAIHVPVALSI